MRDNSFESEKYPTKESTIEKENAGPRFWSMSHSSQPQYTDVVRPHSLAACQMPIVMTHLKWEFLFCDVVVRLRVLMCSVKGLELSLNLQLHCASAIAACGLRRSIASENASHYL